MVLCWQARWARRAAVFGRWAPVFLASFSAFRGGSRKPSRLTRPSPPPPSTAPPSAANTPLSRPLLLLLQQDGGGEVAIVGDPSVPSAGSRCGWRSLLRFRFGLACPTSGRRRYMPSALFPAGLVAEKRDIVGSYMFFSSSLVFIGQKCEDVSHARLQIQGG